MTRYEKSDSHVLADLIEDFRIELEAEIPLCLHPSPPPVGKRTRGMPAGDMGAFRASANPPSVSVLGVDYGWTGWPFHPRFQRYIGHPEDYGYEFIAASAFEEIVVWCRINHDESHWDRDDPAVSLCRRIAVAVVDIGQPLAFVANQEGQTLYNVRQFLLASLKHAAEWRETRRKSVTARDEDAQRQTDDPISETLNRQHNEAHEQKVWARMRIRHPYLSDWDAERERRQEQHRKLGCQECMSKVA